MKERYVNYRSLTKLSLMRVQESAARNFLELDLSREHERGFKDEIADIITKERAVATHERG